MNMLGAVLKNTNKSLLRRYAAPLACIFILTIAILFGVSSLLEQAVKSVIRADAEQTATGWATKLDSTLNDLDALRARGMLSAEQQDVVHAASTYSNVYSVVIFDIQGMIVYSSDFGVVDTDAEQGFSQDALNVATQRHPYIDLVTRAQSSGETNVYVRAYVPAFGPDGRLIGVISLYFDKTKHASAYRTIMNWIGLTLPLLSAILYVIPSLAFLAMREKAHARARRAERLSRFDQLTGTLNRNTISMESRAVFHNRLPEDRTGVVFLDIDKFKGVNDEFGHEFGDAVLHHIASIILDRVRKTDLVGRMGGDEFVIILPRVEPSTIEHIAKRILRAARHPFEYNGTTIKTSLSMGYIVADQNMTAKEALHAADLALYHAKSTGRDSVVEYFSELDTAMIRRRTVEARMREAVTQNEFETYFQPIVKPADHTVVGFETLLRLKSATGEPIPPSEFIPIAEETGIIHDIGCLTLRNAIAAAKTWPDHIFVSVNLSPAQFGPGTLVDYVAKTLEEYDFAPHRLEFEVTEGLLMSDKQSHSDQLVGLKSLGVSIAMDDFGTGYSSLGYLWKYDFNKLKIDQVFLEGLDFDHKRYREIIETIVTLGHTLGMTVTVEGVESEAQASILDKLQCDQYQGFLFGKPMRAQDTLAAISRLQSAATG